MLPEITPAVARALQSAHVYAVAEGKAEREPIHALHGLLEEEEGRAAILAARAGLQGAQYQAARPAAAAGPAAAVAISLPLHSSTESVLHHARDIQRELSGESTVTGEALLLALVRDVGEARALLEAFGFRAQALEAVL